MHVLRGGVSGPTLLLLHGLGGVAEVWQGVTEHWAGRWIAPDLPGHGRSEPLPDYTFEVLAAEVADLASEDTVILGHSLGGVVGLTVAAHRPVRAVIGLGIKVRWAEDELARAAAIGAKPPARFDSREAAADRFLKVAGLVGLVAPDSPMVDAGLRAEDGGWTLALDNAAFAVGAPDMPGLLGAAKASVTLAAGEHDPMCPRADLEALGVEPAILTGLGHNAHLEDPGAVGALLRDYYLAS